MQLDTQFSPVRVAADVATVINCIVLVKPSEACNNVVLVKPSEACNNVVLVKPSEACNNVVFVMREYTMGLSTVPAVHLA